MKCEGQYWVASLVLVPEKQNFSGMDAESLFGEVGSGKSETGREGGLT